MIKKSRLYVIYSTTLVLTGTLTGCANYNYAPPTQAEVESRDVLNNTGTPTDETNIVDTSTPLAQQQFNRQRAEHFESITTSSASQKTDALLSSAEYYIQAQDYQGAQNSIAQLNAVRISPQQLHRLNIIKAYLDYAQQDYRVSLNRLTRILENNHNSETDTPPSKQQLVDALLLNSFNHQALSNNASAIEALIEREHYLSGHARAENARYAWQLIQGLSDTERTNILATSPNAALRNRLEQSDYENYNPSPAQPSQFEQWRSDSTQQTTQDIDNQWQANSARHIAVLLPLTSKFNKAAQAVYDGIEYQHQLNTSAFKPKLDVYDIGNNPAQVHQYYYAAQQSGADLVIGPLGMDFADYLNNALSQYNALPTILLGGNRILNQRNIIRLDMSPEQEGMHVAQRALAHGYVNAALLLANNSSSERTANAFQQYWLEQGGKISNVVRFSTTQFDHSTEIKQLFDISNSEHRRRQLAATLGFRPKFSAYRRQDIDFIFMIANNQTGRIIRPQINFFEGRNIPVFATSNIYNGVQDEINNMDLEGTQFPTLPWVFESSEVSQYGGQLNALFALGIDAYSIAANFSALRNDASLSIAGKMGQLSIDSTGQVKQTPIWASFKQGLAVTSAAYVPLLPGNANNGVINNTTHKGRNRYDESNWDAGGARRKAGVALPNASGPNKSTN